MCVIEADCDTDDGDKELTDQHAASTVDQKSAASEPLDCVEGDGRRADVDEVEDEGDEERVGNCASRLQEGRGVVEDEVDTSPLLHHLKRSAEDCLPQVGV